MVVNVTPTQAAPGDTVTVSGSGFPAGSRAQVYIDGPNHPLGPSNVVGSDGTFTATVTIPAGATVDLHQICAQVNTQPSACAQLQVTAAPVATPTATPVPTPTATPTPAAVPTTAATPRPTSNGLLASLFPWILIPIAILLILAVIAIVLLIRSRGSKKAGGQAAPPPVVGDPRGIGQPTVTHRSPRGYQPPEDEAEPVTRGYWRRGLSTPPPGEPLPGRPETPGLTGRGPADPGLPGRPNQPGLPGSGPGSRPPGLPPGEEDDPFGAPPRR